MKPEARAATRPRGRRTAVSAGRTRALIVQSACDLVAEGGYEALTAAALAERAGVSKGGLYHHFTRMSDVVVAAYKETSQQVFGVLSTGRPADFSEYLDEVEYVIFERLLKDEKTLRVMAELYPRLMFDASYRPARQQSFDQIMEKTSSILSDSFREKIEKKQVKLAVNAVAAFVTGLAVQNREVRNVQQSREMWSFFREALNDKVKEKQKATRVA